MKTLITIALIGITATATLYADTIGTPCGPGSSPGVVSGNPGTRNLGEGPEVNTLEPANHDPSIPEDYNADLPPKGTR